MNVDDIVKGILEADLNHEETQRIYSAIKANRNLTASKNIIKFNVGEKVIYDGKKHLKGKIVRINRTRIIIEDETTLAKWSVPANLVEKVPA